MSDDPFDDGRKKAADERDRRRRRKEIADLKSVLSAVEGRRFLWRLLTEASIFTGCFDPNALSMAFKEGKRDIGLFILQEMKKVSFEVLGQMEREADSDRRSEEEDFKKAEKKRLDDN